MQTLRALCHPASMDVHALLNLHACSVRTCHHDGHSNYSAERQQCGEVEDLHSSRNFSFLSQVAWPTMLHQE